MKRIILPFEKEVISKEEMKEHIDWYVSELERADSISDNNEKTIIYRTVRDNLMKETKHYEKTKVEESYTSQSVQSRAYCESIIEIYRNSGLLNRTVSEVIFDLLSDFKYYIKMYDPS